MFEARWPMLCAECRGLIRPGQLSVGVGPGTYIHHVCPDRGDDDTEGVVPPKAEKQKSGDNVGKVACDAYGNPMAVMTGHGWEEVSGWPALEYTEAGNAFANQPQPGRERSPLVAPAGLVSVGELGRQWVGLAKQSLATAERPLPRPILPDRPTRPVPAGRCPICADTVRPCTGCASKAELVDDGWRGGW